MIPPPDLWTVLADERRSIADLLESLTPAQWKAPTLCQAWDVHAMAAHLLVPCEFSAVEMALSLVRSRGNPERATQLMVDRRSGASSDELVAALRAKAEARKAPPFVGVMGPYTDILVHRLDIEIPLGLPDDRPVERWRPALDFLVSSKARMGFVPRPLPDLWWQATDLEWQHGEGEVVSGPAAALGLAALGRTPRLEELDGPGVEKLVDWVRA